MTARAVLIALGAAFLATAAWAGFQVKNVESRTGTQELKSSLRSVGLDLGSPAIVVTGPPGRLVIHLTGSRATDAASAEDLGRALAWLAPDAVVGRSSRLPRLLSWSTRRSGIGRMETNFDVDVRRLRDSIPAHKSAPLLVVLDSRMSWVGQTSPPEAVHGAKVWRFKPGSDPARLQLHHRLGSADWFLFALFPGFGSVLAVVGALMMLLNFHRRTPEAWHNSQRGRTAMVAGLLGLGAPVDASLPISVWFGVGPDQIRQTLIWVGLALLAFWLVLWLRPAPPTACASPDPRAERRASLLRSQVGYVAIPFGILALALWTPGLADAVRAAGGVSAMIAVLILAGLHSRSWRKLEQTLP